MVNHFRYYQYLNIDVKEVPKVAAPHFLTYDTEEDDDLHYGGGENILMPSVKKSEMGQSSLMGALFNLTTTIVGGGTLSIPFAMAATGSILGVLIILMSACFGAMSAHLLVKLSITATAPAFKDIAIDAYGVLGAKIVELVIVLFTWGAMAAYLVIMENFLTPILNLMVHGFSATPLCPTINCVTHCPWYFDPKFILAVWSVVILLPLGLLKKLSALKYTSVISLLSTCYIVLVVVIRSIQSVFFSDFKLLVPDSAVLFLVDLRMFVAFPILVIAFAFHMNLGPVQMDLQNPTMGRVQAACGGAVSIGTVLYIVMGIFGYILFGGVVSSNVLNSFVDPSDILVQIGRCMFLLVVTMAFPLIVYPCRSNLQTLLFRKLTRDNLFHYLVTPILLVTAYGVAISGVSLGLVFGVVGATCGNFLIYTFPGALYLKLSEERWLSWRKIYSVFAIIFGIIMMVLCLFATLYFKEAPACKPSA